METMADYLGPYATAYRGPADVAWKMGKILLKYRPIAPKPATGTALAAPPVSAKRKGGDNRSRRGRKRRSRSPATAASSCSPLSSSSSSLVTLSLIPVTPQKKEDEHVASTPSPTSSSEGRALVKRLASAVTVECVTDACDTWQMPPFASHALLEHDACPGFVSETCGMVTWTNLAYRKMVVGAAGGGWEVDVELSTKGMVPENATCFTCGARVRYVCGDGGAKVNMVVPCDVWRLGDGKLAWRLDVKAALSLSL